MFFSKFHTDTGVHSSASDGHILASADQGATFTAYGLPFKVGGNMPGRGIGERLVVDPHANNILFLGARSGNGLYKSTNYGETWAKVTSLPNAGLFFYLYQFLYEPNLV